MEVGAPKVFCIVLSLNNVRIIEGWPCSLSLLETLPKGHKPFE